MTQQKGYDSKGRYFTDPNSDKYWNDYPLGDSSPPVCGDSVYREIECDWWNHEAGERPYEASCWLPPDDTYLSCFGTNLTEAKRALRAEIDVFFNQGVIES